VKPYERPGPNKSEANFKAKRSVNNGGNLAVVGDLTLTRIERSANMIASEGYYGAEYDEPIVHTASHEVTLLLQGASIPAAQNGQLELVGTISVSRERFPQLMAALAFGNWPSMVVEDEKCDTPTKVGTDYFGGACAGIEIDTAGRALRAKTVVGGNGYYGFNPAVSPETNQATLSLDLKLSQMASVAPGMAKAAGN
jgi:hypothetical protein